MTRRLETGEPNDGLRVRSGLKSADMHCDTCSREMFSGTVELEILNASIDRKQRALKGKPLIPVRARQGVRP